MGLPLAVHVLIFGRSKCQMSDAHTAYLKFCYLEKHFLDVMVACCTCRYNKLVK